MNLKDKMDLRILAINAHNIYIDEFSLEDDDYIDYRAVRGKDLDHLKKNLKVLVLS